ncbi:MAG TPA: hypothetical protein VFL47_06540 [Flavisolibacter sp.]|nr:hypothetical protein [Flavisolibacter sp.]
MRRFPFGLLKTSGGYLLLTTLTIAFIFSCRKSDHADVSPAPAISYKQKTISIAEDVAMMPVKPDSTGGPIT